MAMNPPAATNSIMSTDVNQRLASSLKDLTLDSRQRSQSSPQRCVVLDQAMQLGLPHHLVLQQVRKQIWTRGSNYPTMRELLSDLFEPTRSPSGPEAEVPMLTNQLEDLVKEFEMLQACLLLDPKQS